MRGRNPEYTAEEMREAIYRNHGVVMEVSRDLDCSPALVYYYADKYSTVQEALDFARMDLAARAEGYHVKMMQNEDHPHHYKAVMDILRNFHPDDWSDEKTEQQVSGDDDAPLTVKVVNGDLMDDL